MKMKYTKNSGEVVEYSYTYDRKYDKKYYTSNKDVIKEKALAIRRAKGKLDRTTSAEIRYIKKTGEDYSGALTTVFDYLCRYYLKMLQKS